jgi:hypothetical protein
MCTVLLPSGVNPIAVKKINKNVIERHDAEGNAVNTK